MLVELLTKFIINRGFSDIFQYAQNKIQNFVSKDDKSKSIVTLTQLAYVESFQDIARLSDRQDILQKKDNNISDNLQEEIKKLQLKDFEFIETKQIITTLFSFHLSLLANDYNTVFVVWLKELGFEKEDAEIFLKRVAINTSKHIFSRWLEQTNLIQSLINFNVSDFRESEKKYSGIDKYFKDIIEPLPNEGVFQENFTLRDIYVPLKGKAIIEDTEGKYLFPLEDKVKKILLDPKKQDQVIFIQGGPGRGKSVFCKMFAHRVMRELHPIFTPILIKLRDIVKFDLSFDQIITNEIKEWGFADNRPWLSDDNTQYLFILDGFDELRMEGRASGGIQDFIRQVGIFQEKWQQSRRGHRIILTGRPLALQGISYLPNNLEKIKLEIMDDNLQNQWLDNWQKVVDTDSTIAEKKTKAFKEFLQADNCPEGVKNELAKEPLLLYLLAAMHRDGEIKIEKFQGLEKIQAKVLVYESSLEWVLKEKKSNSETNSELLQLRSEIIGLQNPKDFDFFMNRILTETGLCVIQSNVEYVKVNIIEARLEKDDSKINTIEAPLKKDKSKVAEIVKQVIEKGSEKALNTALCVFYLKSSQIDKGGAVEFYHKTFSEFLCAKRFKDAIEGWTLRIQKSSKKDKFLINDKQFAKEIYDLFGYGGLSVEIVEYLMELLKKSDEFKPLILFERLEEFFYQWADGEFINGEGENLPMWKMKQLKRYSPKKEKFLGVRQVDAYTGLNVMILLLELHRYGKSQENLKEKLEFCPCAEDRRLLLGVIGYSSCLSNKGFVDIVGKFTKCINLSNANLFNANLFNANLFNANLSGSDLSHANLTKANLSNANLTGANFFNAYLFNANFLDTNLFNVNLSYANSSYTNLSNSNLSNSNLSHTNLFNANLENSNFTGADLSHTNLTGANFSYANLTGANFSYANLENTNFSGANLENTNFSGANLEDTIIPKEIE